MGRRSFSLWVSKILEQTSSYLAVMRNVNRGGSLLPSRREGLSLLGLDLAGKQASSRHLEPVPAGRPLCCERKRRRMTLATRRLAEGTEEMERRR